jgi:hypothetical protein
MAAAACDQTGSTMTHHESPAEIAARLDHRQLDILRQIVRFDGAAPLSELAYIAGQADLNRLAHQALVTHGDGLWRVTDLGRAVVRNA